MFLKYVISCTQCCPEIFSVENYLVAYDYHLATIFSYVAKLSYILHILALVLIPTSSNMLF